MVCQSAVILYRPGKTGLPGQLLGSRPAQRFASQTTVRLVPAPAASQCGLPNVHTTCVAARFQTVVPALLVITTCGRQDPIAM